MQAQEPGGFWDAVCECELPELLKRIFIMGICRHSCPTWGREKPCPGFPLLLSISSHPCTHLGYGSIPSLTQVLHSPLWLVAPCPHCSSLKWNSAASEMHICLPAHPYNFPSPSTPLDASPNHLWIKGPVELQQIISALSSSCCSLLCYVILCGTYLTKIILSSKKVQVLAQNSS